ncbi:MAG: transcription antitermination factor NusB [Deltaproteobacteria bacterium]|nr:transcription antitermination factor NusB [Deltaproteobacteria bacterium]
MGVQRKSRQLVLQLLFQSDLNGESLRDPDFFRTEKPKVSERAQMLFQSILDKRTELDRHIESASQNWKLSRMGAVDRNILRLATYELLYCPDIPGEVILDEAIEIAKRFGSEDSSAFVNGILDKLLNLRNKDP